MMMLRPPQISLLLVPTVALGQNHQEDFENMGVKSIFLRGKSTKADYDIALGRSIPAEARRQVIILTPESLFGTDMTSGILDQLNPETVMLIAIDEVHLVHEWANFRDAFARIKQLKDCFNCPIIALTATILPVALESLKTSVLRNPVGE